MLGDMTKLLIPFALLALACSQLTPLQEVTFLVKPGSATEISIEMSKGDVLEYAFQSSSDIDFAVHSPTGGRLGGWSRVISLSTRQFQADVHGTHALVFSNTFSLVTSKSVALEYRVLR